MKYPPRSGTSRRLTRVLVSTTALAATALGLMSAAQTASAALFTDARLVSGDAFMTNGVVEVGARPNGSFGSNGSAPTGYHPRTNNGQTLGFRSDRGRDGWGTGVDDGDFFTPGNPYEGFALQVGSGTTNFHLNSNRSDGLAGSYTGTTNDSTGQSFTWKTSAPVNGLDLTQVAAIEPNGQYLMVTVTLTNTTTDPINNIYYVRSVDPDNCVTNTGQSCYGSYATTNTVVSQQSGGVGKAAVSATAADGSYIDLRSSAADSIAARAFGCNSDLSLLWSASPCGAVAKNSTDTSDSWIGLGVRTTSLSAGASRTFRLAYVLSAADAGAIDAAAPPTLPGATLPTGYADESYTASAGAVEGGTPITYTVDSGTLPDGLTLDSGTGTISGTPTGSGDSTFAIKATNAKGTDTRTYTISLAPARVAPTLPTTTPAKGFEGEAYSGSVAATAGTAPVTYAIDAGLLPPGLTLNTTTGAITGTPSAEGSYSVTIKATNAKGSTTQTYVHTVGAVRVVPDLDAATLPAGYNDEAYTTSVAATTGTAPITYSVDSGVLPAGLSLDPATGAISGTPTVDGSFTFVIKADNGKGSDTQSYTITLGAARAVPVLPTVLPDGGWVDEAYTTSFAATAGTAPVSYSVTSGALPAGLTLDAATGAVSGTPTTAGEYTFEVRAANGKGSVTKSYTIKVGSLRTVPVLPAGTLRTGVTGAAYSQSIAAAGTKPVGYAVTDGALPAGLHLDPDTGMITGKPTKSGTYRFAVTATNGRGSDTQAYSITVNEAYTVPGSSRAKAERADRALHLTVPAPKDDGGSPVTGYRYSLDGGRTWHPLKVVKGKAVIKGLVNGKKYTVSIRALNKAGAGRVRTITATPGWFSDPITKGTRAKLVSVPSDPRSYKGKVRTTKAANSNASGAAAIAVDKVHGRHLSKGQAVLVGGAKMFKFDSATLTPKARAALRSLVKALGDVKAIRCEGYADYGVDKAQEMSLSKQRAVAVCTYLAKHGVKIAKSIKAYGSSRPVVVGGKSSDRAANRRVVVTVTK